MGFELVGFEKLVNRLAKAADAVPVNHKRAVAQVGHDLEVAHSAIINAALHGDSFSGWRRGNRIPLVAKATPVVGGDGFRFVPNPRALGPERVAESGRKAYAAGDRRLTGKTSKKTGKALSRKVKGTVGKTDGKGTWTATVDVFQRTALPKVSEAFVKSLEESFRG
jgi:hypothetical protein